MQINHIHCRHLVCDPYEITAEQNPDNAKVVVEVTDKTKSVEVKDTKSTLVTDIRVPSMLSVENPNKSLTTIQITFSEPIQNATGSSDGANNAEKLAKWVIDSTNLNNEKYGTTTGLGEQATVTVGKFDKKTGKDSRNIVTIKLGKDKNGEQIYFKAGSHSVQGNNIGDWANMTDTQNNIINTQTLDFTIEANTEAPTAEVKVESPEQYYLKFNTNVSLADLKANLKLQKYVNGSWVNENGNPIDIRAITDSEGTEYIVELTSDWTQILDTANSNKNYYNYDFRLHLEKETIKNVSNGIKNAEINLDLNGDIMDTPDVTSPTLKDATADSEYVLVDFSEPVQLPGFGRTMTPTTAQGTLSVPTVQFISEDNTTTINGTIYKVNDHDTQISVIPASKLSAGTWKVVVRSVSDDVGNTATTLVKEDFKVEGTVVVADTSFKALWAVAVPAGKVNPLTGVVTPGDEDIIYIKFNKMFKTYGSAANAGATTNYTVNGYSVPSTSKIDSSLEGYNHKANIKNNYTDLVAIHLTKGTLTTTSNTINISKTIQSVGGATLGNGGLKLLTDVNSGQYFAWNYAKYQVTSGLKTADALQNALNDGSYYEYKLEEIADSTLNLSSSTIKVPHAVTVDFNGKHVKELNIKTDETGIIRINDVKADTITVDAPNADVYITDSTADKLDLVNVLEGTLQLEGVKIDKINVTDSDGASIVTTGLNKINEIQIDTTSKLGLRLSDDTTKEDGTKVLVLVVNPVKLLVAGNLNNILMKVTDDAKELKVTQTADATGTIELTSDSAVESIEVKTDASESITPIEDAKIVPTVTIEKENITSVVSGTAVSEVVEKAKTVTGTAITTNGAVKGSFAPVAVYVTSGTSVRESANSARVLEEGNKIQVVYEFTPEEGNTYAKVEVLGKAFTVKASSTATNPMDPTDPDAPEVAKVVTLSGITVNSGDYKLYSKESCGAEDEIKTDIVVTSEPTTVYAYNSTTTIHVTIELTTTDGETVTAEITSVDKTEYDVDASSVNVSENAMTINLIEKLAATTKSYTTKADTTLTLDLNDPTATLATQSGFTFSNNELTIASEVTTGTYTLEFTAEDNAFTGTAEVTVEVDANAPTVVVASAGTPNNTMEITFNEDVQIQTGADEWIAINGDNDETLTDAQKLYFFKTLVSATESGSGLDTAIKDTTTFDGSDLTFTYTAADHKLVITIADGAFGTTAIDTNNTITLSSAGVKDLVGNAAADLNDTDDTIAVAAEGAVTYTANPTA